MKIKDLKSSDLIIYGPNIIINSLDYTAGDRDYRVLAKVINHDPNDKEDNDVYINDICHLVSSCEDITISSQYGINDVDEILYELLDCTLEEYKTEYPEKFI